MVRVDLLDPALPKNKYCQVDFPVFWCLDCCEWGPMFFDLSKERVIPFGKGMLVAKALDFSKSNLGLRSVSLMPVVADKKIGRKTKLGGSPAWIQGEQIPECPKCKHGMTFVLQLASNSQISFGDMGMLYAFVCPDCKVSATLIQSH